MCPQNQQNQDRCVSGRPNFLHEPFHAVVSVQENIPFHDQSTPLTGPGQVSNPRSCGPCCHAAHACPHHSFERGFPHCIRCGPDRARSHRSLRQRDGPLDDLKQLRKVNIMKNTVTLVGFVGNTPEVRTAQSGASITTLSLATSRNFKDVRHSVTDITPYKSLGNQPFLWTHGDVRRRRDGDPYGNRTRVSAVKGPRPNR
jgi:Single-strand binding protein family